MRQRVDNFHRKLQTIEGHTLKSASFASTSSTSDLAGEASRYQNLLYEVQDSFTPYEYYVYNVSSSEESSSLGKFYSNAAPKSGSGTYHNPFVPVSSSLTEYTNWLSDQQTSASDYDALNTDRLVNLLPEHIRDDSSNQYAIDFLDMVGEYFDYLKAYVDHAVDIHDRRDDITKGLSKDLTTFVGNSFGLQLKEGKDLVSLPRYLFGIQQTGSETPTTYSTSPEQDISKEIHKRLLSNLPYYYKSKGTKRALEGLINAYGIPSSILRIREYGGPDLPGKQITAEIKRKFARALNFDGGQKVETLWRDDTSTSRKPDTVEIRFRAKQSGSADSTEFVSQSLVEAGEKWGITLFEGLGTTPQGRLGFRISGSAGFLEASSSLLNFLDGDFWSVMLSRESASDSNDIDQTFKLTTKQYNSGKSDILYSDTATLFVCGSSGNAASASYLTSWESDENLYLGGSSDKFGAQFTGSLMEFRMWNQPLTESAFDNHVKSPQSINGNHASASFTDLALRFTLDESINHGTGSKFIKNVARGNYTPTVPYTGSAKDFADKNSYGGVNDEIKTFVPNIGASRYSTTKVRVENNELLEGRNLSYNNRAEISAFDFAPVESNKIGIYFSPSDVINEDIIESVADLDFNQYLGDPRDVQSETYRGLSTIRDSYFQKYNSPNDIWDYIRLLKFYDLSLFDMARQMVPARANATLGLLIEPNILERSKEIVTKIPEIEHIHLEDRINVWGQNDLDNPSVVSMSAEESYFEGSGSYEEIQGRFARPSLYKLSGSSDARNADYFKFSYNENSASVSTGVLKIFEEAVQPFITASRPHEHNMKREFFYSGSLNDQSASMNIYYSSSLVFTDVSNPALSINERNLFFDGCKQTKKTTTDGLSPIEITLTSPTVLVTKEPAESKLKVK
jgi:hypothetical protein